MTKKYTLGNRIYTLEDRQAATIDEMETEKARNVTIVQEAIKVEAVETGEVLKEKPRPSLGQVVRGMVSTKDTE